MRICIVVEGHPSVHMGGAEYQAHLLACELARHDGAEVYYLGRRVPPDSSSVRLPYSVVQIGSAAGVRRHSVVFDAVSLWRTLHRIQPTAVYQRMRQPYTAVCAMYCARHGIPFVFHVAHDKDLDTTVLAGRRLSGRLPFELLDAIVGCWGLSRSQHVIVQTQRQAQLLQARFNKRPLALIRNFHELPTTLRDKDRRPIQVLWIANIKSFKRPAIYVDVAASFADRKDIEFSMIGRPHGHRRYSSMMKRIEALPNLHFRGSLPIEEVNDLIARAHILVNTSEREGFPNTFIQAWSRGAVVVSLGVDVDAGMDSKGIGFCTGTVETLIATIDLLSRDDALRDETARRAFEYVHANHSMANARILANQLLQLAADANVPTPAIQ